MLSMNSMNQLFQKAVLLPDDQRLTLAHKLLTAGEPNISNGVIVAWDEEIRNRIAQYDLGEIHSRSADEVFKKLDLHLKT